MSHTKDSEAASVCAHVRFPVAFAVACGAEDRLIPASVPAVVRSSARMVRAPGLVVDGDVTGRSFVAFPTKRHTSEPSALGVVPACASLPEALTSPPAFSWASPVVIAPLYHDTTAMHLVVKDEPVIVLEAVPEVALFHQTERFVEPLTAAVIWTHEFPPESLSVTDPDPEPPPFRVPRYPTSFVWTEAGMVMVNPVEGFSSLQVAEARCATAPTGTKMKSGAVDSPSRMATATRTTAADAMSFQTFRLNHEAWIGVETAEHRKRTRGLGYRQRLMYFM